VRNLVELSGGSVSAHSAGIGRGSEFVIRLPLGSTPLATSAPSPATEVANANRCRVLVVDDNGDIASALAEVLEMLGCATHVAHDGPSAIRVAADFRADLALLDIGLSVMDGYELARHFRRAPATSAIRLVAVTGYGQPTDAQRSIEAGFDEHIVKPVEIETLRDILTRVQQTTNWSGR
jgi:CheY-like chemotaxis protein